MNLSLKKPLILLVNLLTLLGLTAVLLAFFGSLKPSEKAEAELLRFNISEMPANSYKIEVLKGKYAVTDRYGFDSSILFIKDFEGKLKAFFVLSNNGVVGMPDVYWWQAYVGCQDFRPSVVNGKITPESVIQCNDSDIDTWIVKAGKWHLDGTSLPLSNTANLDPAIGFVDGNDFVYGKIR